MSLEDEWNPFSGVVKVPNRLSATAMAQRVAAQYGQYSAPMYSISGLPPLVSGGDPLIGTIAPWLTTLVPRLPAPTLSSVAAGTLVTSDATLAGRTVPWTPPATFCGVLLLLAYTTMSATTTAITARMLPPTKMP